MSDMQHLADAMLTSAGTVLGRLAEQPATANPSVRRDHEGSVRTNDGELVALAQLPSIGAKIVVRFPTVDMQQIVSIMLGGGDGGDMGAMQLSIASETVSQIAIAMLETLANELSVASDGVSAELCADPTLLPPPPFESYEGTITLGADLAPRIAIDFAAITMSKLGHAVEEEEPAFPSAQASAQSVAFTAMQPTPVYVAQPGQANLDLVHDVPLQLSAVLGKTIMPLREVVALQSGAVFELDKLAAEPIDLYVNNILIARGEVVVVDDKYAVKVSELNPQG